MLALVAEKENRLCGTFGSCKRIVINMRLGKVGTLLTSVLVVTACSFGPSPTQTVTQTVTSSPSASESMSATTSPTPSESQTPSVQPTASVSPSSSPKPTPSVTPTHKHYAAIYYVGDTAQGLRLYREFRRVTVHSGNSLGLESLRYLVAKGSHSVDPDYTNLWGNGSVINSVKVVGGKAVVDLIISHLNVGSEGEMRAIDQLVWTLTANDKSIKSVRFTSKGQPLESFAGHVDATGSFTRERTYDVLAPIWVTTPSSIQANPVTITGIACTFEAVVAYELTKSGKIVKQGSVTAEQACPVRSAWKVKLGSLPSGTYTFTAIDYSAKDGSITQKDSKKFTIQ